MKYINLFFWALITPLIIFYSGCDDSGVLPHLVPKGRITLTPTNLKTLDVNTDGWYNLWIGLDSAGNRLWYSAGEFNVDASGSPVDLSGNATSFGISDSNSLNLATKCMVTIEKQHNIFPSLQRLISGNLAAISDSLSCIMDISGDLALGSAGAKLLTGVGAYYILNSPTTHNASCYRGIWFCDVSGISHFPDSLALPNNGGWVYQGWLVDHSTNTYYSIGKFYSPYAADLDGAGPCADTAAGYNAPGQDWIQTGGNCPSASLNLHSGNCTVFVTLEPSNEVPGSASDNSPFFLRFFSQLIDPTVGCGQQDNLFNQRVTFPTGRIRIAN